MELKGNNTPLSKNKNNVNLVGRTKMTNTANLMGRRKYVFIQVNLVIFTLFKG